MNKLLTCFLLFSFPLTFNAQTFENYYGGCEYEKVQSVTQRADEIILAGYSNSFGYGKDMYIISIDTLGSTNWSNIYHRPNVVDYVEKIISRGSSLVVLGKSLFQYGLENYHILYLDQNNDPVWAKEYQLDYPVNPSNNQEGLRYDDIINTLSGGFALSGQYIDPVTGYRKPHVLILDSNGIIIESQTFDLQIVTYDSHYAVNIDQLEDSSFVVIGDQSGPGGSSTHSSFIAKLDSSLNVLWSKKIEMTGESTSDIIRTSDDGFIFGGAERNGFNDHPKPFICKLNSQGTVEWYKAFDASPYFDKHEINVYSTSDGKYMLMSSYDDSPLAIKIDPNGNIIWSKLIGPESPYSYGHTNLFYAYNTNYFFISNSSYNQAQNSPFPDYYDFVVTKTDTSGYSIGTSVNFNLTEIPYTTFSSPFPLTPIPAVPIITADLLFTKGAASSTYNSSDCASLDFNETSPTQSPFSIFPNPTLGTVTVSHSNTINVVEVFNLAIYNSLGFQVLYMENVSSEDFQIDLSEFGAGLYNIHLFNDYQLSQFKIIVE